MLGIVLGIVFGLVLGLVLGIVLGIVFGLVFGIVFGIVFGLVLGIVLGIVLGVDYFVLVVNISIFYSVIKSGAPRAILFSEFFSSVFALLLIYMLSKTSFAIRLKS